MENATKALLIAAAVLIVIVIIALGVRLLASVGDTSPQAQTASDEISNASDKAIANLQVSLNNGDVFKLLSEYIDGTKTGVSKSKVLTLLEEIEKYNKEVKAGKKDGKYIYVNYKNSNDNYAFNKRGHLTFVGKYSLEDFQTGCLDKFDGTYTISREKDCTEYTGIQGKKGMIDETRLGCIKIQEEKSKN